MLVEETPARGGDDEPACDLDDDQTYTEEGQDFAADQKGDREKDKSVSRYFARQNLLRNGVGGQIYFSLR